MNLRRLAARQKRAQQWSKSVAQGNVREDLRVIFVDTLRRYKNHLAKCWEVQSIDSDEAHILLDLERQLQDLENESRLVA